jgi:hypothetical protein
MERHPWTPSDCSILELAMKGKTMKTLDPLLIDEQLKAIRERLTLKQYEKVHGILEKKGWIIGTGARRSQLEGAFTA